MTWKYPDNPTQKKFKTKPSARKHFADDAL